MKTQHSQKKKKKLDQESFERKVTSICDAKKIGRQQNQRIHKTGNKELMKDMRSG